MKPNPTTSIAQASGSGTTAASVENNPLDDARNDAMLELAFNRLRTGVIDVSANEKSLLDVAPNVRKSDV